MPCHVTDGFFSPSSPPPSLPRALSSVHRSPAARAHLVDVYNHLTLGVALAAVGAWLHLQTNLGGLLSALGALGCLLALSGTPDSAVTRGKRTGLFLGFTLLKGLSLGPLIAMALRVNPALITTAALGTTLVFACFSASAYFSDKRSMIYLGGLLGSALSLLALASLINLFVGSALLFNMQLYGGLLVFCGYVVFDTQMILFKADMGQRDPISGAVELFIDFAAIFVRILIILMKNSGNKQRRDDRRR